MASKLAKEKPKISDPLLCGTTLLPSRVLSYRWVIGDAKIFLESIVKELNSPFFSIDIPRKGEWYLKITKCNDCYKVNLYFIDEQIPSDDNTGSIFAKIANCTYTIIKNEEVAYSSNSSNGFTIGSREKL